MPISTNPFAQEYDCFENHSIIFLFLKHIMNYIKTSDQMLIVDRIMSMFL